MIVPHISLKEREIIDALEGIFLTPRALMYVDGINQR